MATRRNGMLTADEQRNRVVREISARNTLTYETSLLWRYC